MTGDWQTVPFNQYFAAIVLSGVYGLFIFASRRKFLLYFYYIYIYYIAALNSSFICYWDEDTNMKHEIEGSCSLTTCVLYFMEL